MQRIILDETLSGRSCIIGLGKRTKGTCRACDKDVVLYTGIAFPMLCIKNQSLALPFNDFFGPILESGPGWKR